MSNALMRFLGIWSFEPATKGRGCLAIGQLAPIGVRRLGDSALDCICSAPTGAS